MGVQANADAIEELERQVRYWQHRCEDAEAALIEATEGGVPAW